MFEAGCMASLILSVVTLRIITAFRGYEERRRANQIYFFLISRHMYTYIRACVCMHAHRRRFPRVGHLQET